MLMIEDQSQLGACTAFGSGSLFEAICKKMGLTQFQISKLAQYYWTRLTGGFPLNQDTGAYVRDAMKSLATYGAAFTADWPYIIQNFAIAPPAIAAQHGQLHQALKYISIPTDINQIRAVLSAGYPVVFGFSVAQNFMTTGPDGMVPRGAGAIIGGHCTSIVGHDDGISRGKIRNSWSQNWGKGGYAWMLYEDIIRYGADFWMLSEVEGDVPTPPPPPPPPPVVKTYEQGFADAKARALTAVQGIAI
jgi:C1A family cysteine protease